MIKPIAIFYADKLEDLPSDSDGNFLLINNAADELRRLHSLNFELLEALKLCQKQLQGLSFKDSQIVEALERTHAAIAKATGQNAKA